MPKDIQKAIPTGIQEASPNGREAITPDQARALLAQEQQARVDAAKAELDQFLPRWAQFHRVRLEVAMIVTARGNVPQLQIVAEE